MDHFKPSYGSLASITGTALRNKMEAYKVDEGYSEDTRSQDGSEASVQLNARDDDDSLMQLQSPLVANIDEALRGLSEIDRSGMLVNFAYPTLAFTYYH